MVLADGLYQGRHRTEEDSVASAVGEDRSDFQAAGGSWSANDFGFTKFTESDNWEARTARGNWDRLRAQGKVRGGYHFLHPAVSGVTQANFFINYVKACGGWADGDMFACDAEISVGADGLETIEDHRRGRMHGELLRVPAHRMDASVGSVALQFCNRVAQLVGPRCPVLLYTYSAFRSSVADCVRYPLWIASYSSHPPASVSPWPHWTLWQNSDHGGQGGGDTNRFNGTAAQLRSWLAAHGGDWTEEAVMALPTLKQGAQDPVAGMLLVHRIQNGCAGIGRWNNMGAVTAVTDDGHFGATTTAAVKAVQKKFGLTQDGEVGPATWKALIGI